MAESPGKPREGGCQCGKVRYRINATPLTLYCCHCTECQAQSASAFGMSMWVEADGFEVLKGELSFYLRPTASGNTMKCAYCPDCGTRIYHQLNDDNIFTIKPGSLDDSRGLKPRGHIWTRSALAWVRPVIEACDGPSFETEPEDFVFLKGDIGW